MGYPLSFLQERVHSNKTKQGVMSRSFFLPDSINFGCEYTIHTYYIVLKLNRPESIIKPVTLDFEVKTWHNSKESFKLFRSEAFFFDP